MRLHNSAVAQALVGAWRLIALKIEYTNETAVQPFGSDARGSIIYTDTGRVACK
ncbi:MAG: lipocalin-like domain-containing protein [Gammaproteobacteria bacterium]